MKSAVFWGITRRRMVIVYRRFGTTYRSHPHGSRVQVHSYRNNPEDVTHYKCYNISPYLSNRFTIDHNLNIVSEDTCNWNPLKSITEVCSRSYFMLNYFFSLSSHFIAKTVCVNYETNYGAIKDSTGQNMCVSLWSTTLLGDRLLRSVTSRMQYRISATTTVFLSHNNNVHVPTIKKYGGQLKTTHSKELHVLVFHRNNPMLSCRQQVIISSSFFVTENS